MLYEERRPLYEKYADIVFSTAGMTPDQVMAFWYFGGFGGSEVIDML